MHLPLAASALATLGLAPSLMGTVFALRSGLHVLAPTLWGVMADRRGTGAPFAFASLLGGGLIFLSLAYAQTALAIVVSFVLLGLVSAPSSALLDGVTLTALGPHKSRFGHIRAFGTLGFGLMALLANVAIGQGLLSATPKVVFGTAGVMSCTAALVLLRFPRLPRQPMSRLDELWGLLRLRAFWVLVAITILHWGSHAAYTSFIVPLALSRGIGSQSVGMAIALGICVEVFSMRKANALLVRFGSRSLLLAVLVIAALRWLGLVYARTDVAFILLNGLHGFSFGLFFPVVVTLLAQRTPERMRQSAQGGLVALGFGLGGALGSFGAGLALESYGVGATWLTMFLLSALAIVVAAATMRRDEAQLAA